MSGHRSDLSAIADYLLEEAGVVTVPGNAYGSGEGYLRLSFAYDEHSLGEGLDALVAALKRL